MSKIRVLLADNHAILIAGLRALLSYYEDVEVVGEARDGAEAVARVADLQPDVVLMDITMPGLSGIEATRLIRKQYPQIRVLVLTRHEEQQYVLALLQAGASGYLLKRALGSDLIAALRTVARGETFLDPTASTIIAKAIREPIESLTPRENEILQYVVRGESSQQIAENLSLSTKTVEWHRHNLMGKLGVKNVADLVRFALQYGLVVGTD